MSQFFVINRRQKEKGFEIGAEWYIPRGGYSVLYFERFQIGKFSFSFPTALTFSHRFAYRGNAGAGEEKQFFLRFKFDLAFEARANWFTLEAVNPYEARWFYVMVKLWKTRNLKVVFNFGWALTLASRKVLE